MDSRSDTTKQPNTCSQKVLLRQALRLSPLFPPFSWISLFPLVLSTRFLWRFAKLKWEQGCITLEMNQKIENLNEREAAWIEAQLRNARKFVEGFAPKDAEQPLNLPALDHAFATWTASEPREADLINAIINYVGIAFGQALVDGIGLRWVIATDEQGSDLAVYGFPERGDVLVYPANFVAKRWERRETYFLDKAYTQIARDVQTVVRKFK